MLEVEYAQSSAESAQAGLTHHAILPRAGARGWMLALGTDAAGKPWGSPGLDRLLQRFRSAPEPKSLGVFLSNLIRNAYKRHQLTALVGCALRFDRVVVARSGPASCYVIRNNYATLLTLDRVEVTDYQLRAGDVLLLCTESAFRSVKGSEIAEIATRATDLAFAANQLSVRGKAPLVMIRIQALRVTKAAS